MGLLTGRIQDVCTILRRLDVNGGVSAKRIILKTRVGFPSGSSEGK